MQSRLLDQGYRISPRVIKRLLKARKLGNRKLSKAQTMKAKIPGRDEQFKMIQNYRRYYLSRGYPVLSMDVKKKELLGPFFRPGKCWSDGPIKCYDHDFNSFAWGKVVPHGIYDLGRNEGYLTLCQTADTAAFNVACLRKYWEEYGSQSYPLGVPILILADGGGSNGSRNRLFKQELQDWADEINHPIRVAHFPPYCSKYNPIEHRFFPFITRAWEGVMLDTVQTMRDLIEERSQKLVSGIKIFVSQLNQSFEKGITVFDDYLDRCQIQFEKKNRLWNYRIIPLEDWQIRQLL